MLLKRRDLFAILFLLFIVCFLFFDPLFYGGIFYFRDIFQNHLPIKKLCVELLKNGEFPLWNPYQSFGQPLLANPNYATFHPINLLLLILPFDFAFNLSIILQFFLAGFFFYLLTRDYNLKMSSSLLGSLIFMLSGYMLSLGNLYNVLATTAWLPLTFFLFRRTLIRRSYLYLMGASLSLAIQFLGGEPVSLALTVILLFLYSLYYTNSTKEPIKQRLKNLYYLGIAGFSAVMLGMAQLLPFIRLLLNSERWQGLRYLEVTKWSLNPLRLLELIIPQLLGNSTSLYFKEFSGQSFFDNNYPFIISIYIGILPLLLVVAALFMRWNKETKFWSFIIGISLLLSFSCFLPYYHYIYSAFPLLKIFRYPVKFFMLVNFSLALLAAFGAENLIFEKDEIKKSTLWKKKTNYLLFISFFLVIIVLAIYAWMIIAPQSFKEVLATTYLAGQHSEAWLQRAYVVLKAKCIRSVAFTFFSTLTLFLLISHKFRIHFKLLLAFCIILLDVFPFALEINPTIGKDLLYKPPEVVRFLKQDKESARIYRTKRPKNVRLYPEDPSFQWAYYWDKQVLTRFSGILYNISYGLHTSTDRLHTATYKKFITLCNEMPEATKLKLMGLGNIRYIISFKYMKDPNLLFVYEISTNSDITLKVYQNLLCMPRAYLVENGIWANDVDEAMKLMIQSEFNPNNMVILLGKKQQLKNLEGDNQGIGNCQIVSYEPNRVIIKAEVRKACYLVLGDSYYGGWKVAIDGERGEIVPANILFRAVPLSKGNHTVIFYYRPTLVYLGLLISLGSLLALIGFFVVGIRRKYKVKVARNLK